MMDADMHAGEAHKYGAQQTEQARPKACDARMKRYVAPKVTIPCTRLESLREVWVVKRRGQSSRQ